MAVAIPNIISIQNFRGLIGKLFIANGAVDFSEVCGVVSFRCGSRNCVSSISFNSPTVLSALVAV